MTRLAPPRRSRRKSRLSAPALVACVLAASCAPAWADGNARTGGWLARAWCEGCHGRIGVASDAARSLADIARQTHAGEAWLRAWLADPHPPMPNLTLSRSEIDDIVAYLKTLPAD